MNTTKQIGTVRIEPKTKLEWAAQKMRLKPSQKVLTLAPFTAQTTLDVIDVIQQIKKIESNAAEDVIGTVAENLPIYVHLVATALANGDEDLAQSIRLSISKHWTMEQVIAASQIVYNSIDFAPMFEILNLMGKFRLSSAE